MVRLFVLVSLAALAGACSRTPADPALVENPAPLTDCGDEAFISILGGARAVVCRGDDQDPAVRSCVEAPFAKRQPFAHVVERPGEPRLITVATPEKRVYQVRRFADPAGERVQLFACRPATEMPDEELPFFCPLPGEPQAPVRQGTACQVLEGARSLRRAQAEAQH